MTSTNVEDFKKLLSRIPQDRFKNIWWIPIRQDHKKPDVPLGTKIKGNLAYRLDVKTCINRLNQGKNVAGYALTGGIMYLDLDVQDGKMIASHDFIKAVPESFTVQSRNGGLQFYYLNDGLFDNQLLYENGIEIGELRTDWQYVVAAGSYVTPDANSFDGDGTYRVIKKIPLISFPGLEGINKRTSINNNEIKTFTKETEKADAVKREDFLAKLKETGKIRKAMNPERLELLRSQLQFQENNHIPAE
jgi:hypothetical protein